MDHELSSWKEIAAHLGVGVRTAQVWEKECGLPVRRLPGRNRVIARSSELDAWKNSGAISAPKEQSRWLGWRAAAPGMAGCLLIGVAGWFWLAGRASQPFALRVEGTSLQTFDKAGKILWTKGFPFALKEVPRCNGSQGEIADIDGDGTAEVLFAPHALHLQAWRPHLLCYNADGSERWRYVPGRSVSTARKAFSNEFTACSITVLPGTSEASVAVGSNHALYHPYQVAFLDAQGRPVREFWHPGHLQAMTLQDIDGDGHKELLLGGVNNEVRQATLVALDPARADGAARVHNPAYQFRGLPFAQEKARLYFPRTPVGKGDAFNTVIRLDVSGGRLTVHVDEAPRGPQSTTLFYHLSGQLAVREVGFSDTFSLRAKELGVDLEAERKRLRSVSRE